MTQKLSKERLNQIRSYLAVSEATDSDALAADLLAELDRIAPSWVPVSSGQHMSGFTYDLAGTTADSPRPVWIGKGRYDEAWHMWVDNNTDRPFPASTQVTHYFKTLAPHELIGQPQE